MPLVIRLLDTSDHGGAVVTAASKSAVEGRLIARLFDILECPLHGPQPIIEASPDTYCEGRPVARHGDHAACGAALISLAVKTLVN